MNTQAFPLEFLRKFFPELARAKPASVDSATTKCVPIHTEGAILSATPRFINEPGIVEIILRVRVDGPRLGFLDMHEPPREVINLLSRKGPALVAPSPSMGEPVH
jgi:hypothetical protein